MELSNAFIYGDRLRCDSLDVVDTKLEYTSSTYLSSWLLAKEDLVPGLEVKYGKTVNNHLYHMGFTIKNKIMEGVVWLKKDEVHPWNEVIQAMKLAEIATKSSRMALSQTGVKTPFPLTNGVYGDKILHLLQMIMGPSRLLKSTTSSPNDKSSTKKHNGDGVLADEGSNTKR
ncbi:Dna2 [Artemisia annua]|uniref:Dna2 n=1 Tax=Artemisia annua TaxID=35608 RepID=A0A2U1M2P1_ARTAN|nr:Dna2 [Artemisia annua]